MHCNGWNMLFEAGDTLSSFICSKVSDRSWMILSLLFRKNKNICVKTVRLWLLAIRNEADYSRLGARTTFAGGLQCWRLSCVKYRPVCVPEGNRDAHLVTRVSPSFLVPLIHMFLESPGYYRPQSRLLAASLGKQRDSWAPITRPNRCSGDLQRKWMEKRNGEGQEVMRKKGKPRVDGGSKKWINTLMPELRDFIRNPA